MTAKRTLVVVRSQTNAPLRGGCGDEWYDDDDGEVVMWWPAVVVSVGVARGGEWYSGSDRSGGEEDFGAPSENSPENFSGGRRWRWSPNNNVPPDAMAMGMERFIPYGKAIFEWNLVENAYHESKNLKKEMKTMEASLLRIWTSIG
ncbi:hypothetical protein Tco_0853368 [Tanacetum coccineum]